MPIFNIYHSWICPLPKMEMVQFHCHLCLPVAVSESESGICLAEIARLDLKFVRKVHKRFQELVSVPPSCFRNNKVTKCHGPIVSCASQCLKAHVFMMQCSGPCWEDHPSYGHMEGKQPEVRDLRSPWFANNLLNGMILQVVGQLGLHCHRVSLA